jgi:DnaJ-like protein
VESLYDLLGVATSASAAEITRAYRKLAMRWHPDRNPNAVRHATRRFQGILHAYGTLHDPEKRRKYDESLAAEGTKSAVDTDRQRESTGKADTAPEAQAESSRTGQDVDATARAAAAFFERMSRLAERMRAQGASQSAIVAALVGQGCPRLMAELIHGRWAGDKTPKSAESPASPHSPPPRPETSPSAGKTAPANHGNRRSRGVHIALAAAGAIVVIRFLSTGPTSADPPTTPARPSAVAAVAQPAAAAKPSVALPTSLPNVVAAGRPISARPDPLRGDARFDISGPNLESVLRHYMPDFSMTTRRGIASFPAMPSGETFQQFQPWTNRKLEFVLVGTVDLTPSMQLHYFVTAPFGEDFDCHACIPIVSGIVTQRFAGGDGVVIGLAPIVPAGAYGKYPGEAGRPKVAEIGPKKLAVVLPDMSMSQGYKWAWEDVVEIDVGAKSFRYLGTLPAAADATSVGNCGGTADNPCERFSVTYSVDRSGPGPYYPLASHIQGYVEERDHTVRLHNETKVARFNGAQYSNPLLD